MHLQSLPSTPRRGLVYADIRLKRDVRQMATLDNGIKLYRYRDRWSPTVFVGVLAQEVAEVMPEAVSKDADGYLLVDYRRLGLQLRTYRDWVEKGHIAAGASAA